MGQLLGVTEDDVRHQLASAVSELTDLLSTNPLDLDNLRAMPEYLEKVVRVIRAYLKQ